MQSIGEFRQLIEGIDKVLDSYDPGELAPDKVIREILIHRANQKAILEKVIQLATDGLEKYPFNTELLRRRAFAKCRIVTPDGEFPELESAELDLRMILEYDPNNLYAATDLIEEMFTFSGMDDTEIADIAETFAERAEKLLIKLRALQIKALGHSDNHDKAEEVYLNWIRLFPESEILKAAKEHADSMKNSDDEYLTIISEEEAKKILRESYQLFVQKQYHNALSALNPIINGNIVISNDTLKLHSLMWGIAGDSFFALKDINKAVQAYRKSISLDKYSGCIYSYTSMVTKYNLIEEVAFAHETLTNYDMHLKNNPTIWKIFGNLFALFYMPATWWLFYIEMPIVRIRLNKMKRSIQNKPYSQPLKRT